MSRRRCLAALASPLLWGWRSASAATARPNILFVMIDTLRADHGGILHGRTLHAEQTRGILLLRHPDRLPAGKAVTAPARHVDLTPTLLDLAGAPPDPECQGASLLPHIRGQEAEPRPCFLEGTAGTHLRAVVRGRHKLIRDLDTGAHQLYDLADDPFEKTDVAARHPDLVGRPQWPARRPHRRLRRRGKALSGRRHHPTAQAHPPRHRDPATARIPPVSRSC